MYKEKFENILGENEEIVRIEKVKKTTFIMKKVLSTIITICIFLGILCYVKYLWVVMGIEYNPTFIKYSEICVSLILLLNIIFSFKACSNYFICLTNKRIIIRYGTLTNNFSQYSIDNVTGNIQTICTQSIWDKKDGKDASCLILAKIELLPVGHGEILISTRYSIENGYEMAKEIEKVVKSNARPIDKPIKE